MGNPAALKQARAAGIKDFGAFMSQQARIVNNGLIDRVVPRLNALPGVTTVSGASKVPFVTSPERFDVVIGEGTAKDRQDAWRQSVTQSYFSTLGIPTLDGRTFTAADAGGENVVVVSREFQRRFYPEGAPGKVFRQVYGGDYELEVRYRIIGVAGDVKRQEYTDDLRPLVYHFDRQAGGITHFIIRTTGDPGAILPAARAAIADVSRQLVISDTAILDERVAASIAEERFRATLSICVRWHRTTAGRSRAVRTRGATGHRTATGVRRPRRVGRPAGRRPTAGLPRRRDSHRARPGGWIARGLVGRADCPVDALWR